jgi:hypothetical protein
LVRFFFDIVFFVYNIAAVNNKKNNFIMNINLKTGAILIFIVVIGMVAYHLIAQHGLSKLGINGGGASPAPAPKPVPVV